MASYCAVVPLPDADATGASATLRQAPCPRSLVAGLLLGVLTCAAILRLCHTSAGLGLHDPEPLLDIERLISLTADLNDQDLLSVANEPFQRYVNRTLQDSHIPQAFDVAANVGVAVCVVDVGQALFQLAQGLMAFNAASTGCPDFEDQSEEAKQFCAVAISYGFAGVAWSVSFISLAVSDCAASLDIQAACSADLTSLLGSFSYLSSAISSMTLNCPAGGLEDPAAIIAENSGGAIRRLQGETFHEIQTLEANKAAKKAAKATCVFDVGHAAFWLARVGTSITQATLHCTKQNVESDAGKCSFHEPKDKNMLSDLRGLAANVTPNVGFLSLTLTDQHVRGASEERLIALATPVMTFRNFFLFHLKHTKSFLHSRLRKRLDNWQQQIGKARRRRANQEKRRLISGKEFNPPTR